MTRPTDYRAIILAEMRRQRRALGAESVKRFTEVYLSNCCTAPFSDMHEDLFIDLARLVTKRGGRLVYAAPRGHAKSTIVSLAFVLWCLLYDKERLILIVSATRELAVMLLKHIKDELERNELLRSDFPKLCRLDGGPGSGRQSDSHDA